jgi:hypothetical protein
MHRVGIRQALIGNIFDERLPAGDTKLFTEGWWDHLLHAVREGQRLGVDIGLFNCPGWSQSGGPWINEGQTMRRLAFSETRVTGPATFHGRLPRPVEPFQDVAVLAFPAPQRDEDWTRIRPAARVATHPAIPGAENLADGNLGSWAVLTHANGGLVVDLEWAEPFTARTLALHPADTSVGAEVELFAELGANGFQRVWSGTLDRLHPKPETGFLPRGPAVFSLPPTSARNFRLLFRAVASRGGEPRLGEIQLSEAARLEQFVEKQFGKMHSTHLPDWNAYLWSTPPEPEDPALAVSVGGITNLTARMTGDGQLRWEVPSGEWLILRAGLTPTGISNHPAAPEGKGYEVDKMNRDLARHHFDSYAGQLLQRLPADLKPAFKTLVADSYETGGQNWTEGFAAQFRTRYGYDPLPWLPVLTGRIVESADQSERFLWDLRRLVADRIGEDYIGGLRDRCQAHQLELWLENYGHWGFPGEFLKYGAGADRVAGEFWVRDDDGIELRAPATCANTYGKTTPVSAEAFTGPPGESFRHSPCSLKERTDWAFCEGINHFVLHVYLHQPWEDRRPGMNAWFGTEFNRHNPWFLEAGPWVDYLRRCSWLLQQGHRVADVAYFIGEDTPKMTGRRHPPLPRGHDYDYLNSEVLLTRLHVRDGKLALPNGVSYQALVLPEQETMRPEVLRKVRDLIHAGATVLGPQPSRSPSMQNYPQCDDELRALAREVWGESPGAQGQRRLGAGRIFWGQGLDVVFAALQVMPDFESREALRFVHRRDGDRDIYFLANPLAARVRTTASFRVPARQPELWDPLTGRVESLALYAVDEGRVRLPLELEPHGSSLLVFRRPVAPGDAVAHLTRNGERVWETSQPVSAAAPPGQGAPGLTLAAWVNPAADTALPAPANGGTVARRQARNDLIPALLPPGGGGVAGVGLAVGRNGVTVQEHAPNHFVTILSYAAPIRDWTHVVLVYAGGRPVLYLNGQRVAEGLASPFACQRASAMQPAPEFAGDSGAIVTRPFTLDAAQVKELLEGMPCPGRLQPPPAPSMVSDTPGQLLAQVFEPGAYEAITARGRRLRFTVDDLPQPTILDGAWTVSFDPAWGPSEEVVFHKLESWSRRPEPDIRHYSGRATYRKVFRLPANGSFGAGRRLTLDLRQVSDLARVRLNGHDLGVRWTAPWTWDVSEVVRPGTNSLEVEVINTWHNRLVGDAALPANQRRTSLAYENIKPGSPLLPAGLLGPVSLRGSVIVPLKE